MPDSVAYAEDALDARELLAALRKFKRGDFSVRLPSDRLGIDGEIAAAFNDIVESNQNLSREFSRLRKVVGREGKIAERGKVAGATGGWATCIDSVNELIADTVQPTVEVSRVIGAVARGDLSQKMKLEHDGRRLRGEFLRIGKTVNTMVDQLSSFASEVTRVAREVGTEGKLGGQARVEGVDGTWKDLTDNVNAMATNLTGQVRNIAEVTTAVAKGDLSKKITVDVKGEILELKNTINTMVDQLNSFASEVTRVAREVGTEGKLGGQARVEGVDGTWKDLTDNVNLMATNLTSQVRGIADVVTAVANGNLQRKLTVDAKGEIAALAETINGMIDTLATFADQVTNVAREVGIEGKLGGQARVPGAAGLWRDLTDNVNQLAANLTTQVRAIAEVATAVTKGDLTRSIAVEASGEVAALKDNINEMIGNLKETTRKNDEQDWLKTNLTRFTRMLQGQRDLETVSNLILSEMAPLMNAHHIVFYVIRAEDGEEDPYLDLVASYAFDAENTRQRLRMREGLIGQCAYEKSKIFLDHVPEDYIRISSGIGKAAPLNIMILPVLFEGEVTAVMEIASFSEFSETHRSFVEQLTESIGIVLNTIAATMRTEELLRQSQLLTSELQSQQEELKKTNDTLELQAKSLRESEEKTKAQQEQLRKTNEELEEKARALSNEKKQVEEKNREVELAKVALEDKAEQLALTSKYKSEFLANMSHELRTPLNSLLILSKLLSENREGNLTDNQTKAARTIHSGGTELLSLINDVLDLSKIESGTVTLDVGEMDLSEVRERKERMFGQVAKDKSLRFTIDLDADLPPTIRTDEKRLHQVLRNLLSNAFKFTEKGEVALRIAPADNGWAADHPVLNSVDRVIAFTVTDTGIGIPEEKQKIIFEAFQQADGTTNRKYGGTGLGLSISRELARLLGGEITIESVPGQGSSFTLYVPQDFTVPPSFGETAPTSGDRRHLTFSTKEDSTLFDRNEVVDDRHDIGPDDTVVMIVENRDDIAVMAFRSASKKGLKVLLSTMESALPTARRFGPNGILLGIAGDDMDGWALLDLFKHTEQTNYIPVHVTSREKNRGRALELGAYDFTAEPVDSDGVDRLLDRLKSYIFRDERAVLLVGTAEQQLQDSIAGLFSEEQIDVSVMTDKKDLPSIRKQRFDCVVADLTIEADADIELLESVRSVKAFAEVPTILRVEDLADEALADRLGALSGAGLLRQSRSLDRFLYEITMALHRPGHEAKLDTNSILQTDPSLAGRRVLVIDDDFRNIFALTSALELYEMEVLYAETGWDGIDILKSRNDIDIALVDVMMPELDGYDTIREIRKIERETPLPLIAVTAKAMKGDREKCMEAGASDYLAKPVDINQLLSLLRVWIER